MVRRALITVDLGTTFFKVCLFDDAGVMRAVARVAPPTAHPAPGHWELAPTAFIETLQLAIRQVLREAPQLRQAVAAVSFATQANSFTLLDRHGKPLMPFILWPDERAAGAVDVAALLGRLLAFRAQTGVPELGPAFAVAKLHHLLTTDSALRQAAHALRFLSDYWIEWLTGSAVIEAGMAGLSALLDARSLAWISAAQRLAGLEELMLPPVARAGTDVGVLRREAAESLGLPASCRVVVGALDQYAGAIGVGNVRPGMVSETTGTVLAVVRCAGALDEQPQPFFQGPGWAADRFYRMSFGSVSANILEWYQNGLADRPPYAALDALAAAAPAGAGGLKLKPDALTRSVADGFNGAAASRSRGNEVRCILEAVARALADHMRVLGGEEQPAEVRCAGGGARSDIWLQIKANAAGVPMTALQCREPTSLGAAMLAAQALGWETLDGLSQKWIKPRRTFSPEPGH